MENLQPWLPDTQRAVRKPANLWARWHLEGGTRPVVLWVAARANHQEVPLAAQVALVATEAARVSADSVSVEGVNYYDPTQHVEQDIWQLVALGLSAPAVPEGV